MPCQGIFHEDERGEKRSDQNCILVKPTIGKVNTSFVALLSDLTQDSDILAELDVPPSGIQSVLTPPEYPKSMADHPIAVHDDPGKAKVMTYYCFQLMMRKSLNDIQTELYSKSRRIILLFAL